MQQITGPSVDNLPKTGYYVSNKEKEEKFYQNETHIHKQNILSDVKAGAHKLTNDIFTYFPKGFQGSKNSDFYEYLSLGMVPYLVGSVMMYSLYKGANNFFKFNDKSAADGVARSMGAGILLYGVGKWASKKLAHTLIHASTGVNLDMKYINKVNEVPEPGQEKGLVRTQYPGVFDSVDFYRNDLLDKMSELKHNNVFWYNDQIAKKAGFKEQLNAPNQTMGPKIRALKARTTALENVTKYIAAACGVALGAQESFKNAEFKKVFNKEIFNFKDIIKIKLPDLKALAGNIKGLFGAFVKSFFLLANVENKKLGITKELLQSKNRNIFTKYGGRALLLASALGVAVTWLIPTIGFKKNPDTMQSKVDTKKEYEVC